MNKKDYQKPAMRVVLLQHQQHLLAGSGEVTNVDGSDTGIGFGGGGDGTPSGGGGPRARSFGGWDDEE